jgi:TolB protein
MPKKYFIAFTILIMTIGVYTYLQTQKNPQNIEITASTSNHYQLTDFPEREYHPRWRPNGEHIAYTTNMGDETRIMMIPPEGGTPVEIQTHASGDLDFSWAPDSQRIVYDGCEPDSPVYLRILNLETGEDEKITGLGYGHPYWSPVAEEIVYSHSGNLYVSSSMGENEKKITSGDGDKWHPTWSPDGEKVVFTSDRSGNMDLWIVDVSSGEMNQLTFNTGRDDRGNFSPDGQYVLFSSNRDGYYHLYIIPVGGGEALKITNGSGETHPCWSPDGEMIAYTMDWNIWVAGLEIE